MALLFSFLSTFVIVVVFGIDVFVIDVFVFVFVIVIDVVVGVFVSLLSLVSCYCWLHHPWKGN